MSSTLNESVTVYSMPGCMPCQQVKDFLTRRGVPFDSVLLDDPTALAAFRESHDGIFAVPFTTVGAQSVMGADLDALARAIDQLTTPTRPGLWAAEQVLPPHTGLTGTVAVANTLENSVLFFEPIGPSGAMERRATIPVPDRPIEVFAWSEGETLATLNFGDASVTFLSAKDGGYLHGDLASSTFSVGPSAQAGMANPAAPLLYVASKVGGHVAVLDAATGGYVNGTLEQSRLPMPCTPYNLAYHPGEEILYVASVDTYPGVVLVDGRRCELLGRDAEASTLPTKPGYGLALSGDGQTLYRLSPPGSEGMLHLYAALPGSSRHMAAQPTGPMPLAVCAHPSAPIVYVSCVETRVVEFRDADTGVYLFGSAERSSFPVGRGARAMMVDPRDNTLYVSSFSEGRVFVLDALTGEHRSTIDSGDGPSGFALIGRSQAARPR